MPDDSQPSWHIVSAKNAELTRQESSGGILSLINGESYQMPLNSGAWSISNFQKYDMAIRPKVTERKSKLRAISTWQLLSNLNQQHWAELHWRLAISISTPLLIFLAIPISRVEPRQGKFARMLPALLLYLSYMIFLMLGRGLIEDGKVPGELGLWWVHGLFAMFVLWQYANPHTVKRSRSKLGLRR
jgi:lipopolysaccharide export system permease protein